MRYSLTPAQAKLFAFIEQKLTTSYVAPTFEEMMAHMGLASKSGIHRIVSALQERGWVVRLASHARAMRICGEDEDVGTAAPPSRHQRAPRYPERDASIVALRARGATLRDIGDEYGITAERVRQICKTAA